MINAPVMMGALHANGDWAKCSLYCIVRRLLTVIVVDEGPRGTWPAIVELPDESSTTETIVAPLATPALIREFHCFGLNELS